MCTALLSHRGLNFRNAVYPLRASTNAFVWSTVFQTLFDKEWLWAVPVHTKSIHSANITQIRLQVWRKRMLGGKKRRSLCSSHFHCFCLDLDWYCVESVFCLLWICFVSSSFMPLRFCVCGTFFCRCCFCLPLRNKINTRSAAPKSSVSTVGHIE